MAKARPIRIGIVGIGRAGWGMHCKELEDRREKFEIVAACDIIKERRDLMADRYGCKTYRRIEELIEDRDVELVDIATRSRDHFEHARLALLGGKDVFLEKPMCRTYEEARKLKRVATRGESNLYVRHNRRFEPCFNHVREIIDSGILGDVFQVKLRRLGFGRRSDWQTLKRYGGGQTMNWGPHIIDHALRLLDSPLKHVWGDTRRIAAAGDADDHVKIVLTGRNGRVVDLEVSGGAALVDEPVYVVWGHRGGLWSDDKVIRVRYLDPSCPDPEDKADPSTPHIDAGFMEARPKKAPGPKPKGTASPPFRSASRPKGGADKWIEKTFPVAPKNRAEMPAIWDALYDTIRKGKPFPISLDEALDVMKVTDMARRGSR